MVPYFSVIIPAHNEENYIRTTLHSLKNQTLQDYESIVVANGCTDGTEEIVRKRTDEKLRLLSLPKANVSVARNAGALNAQGKVLVFLDADTTLAADSLQKMKEQFTERYMVASTKVEADSENIKYRILAGLKSQFMKTNIYQTCSGALICRKEDFQKVGGYHPEIIVKEHLILIKKLKELGKYTCLDTTVVTSMRRFQKWGLAKTALFWTKQWLKYTFSNLKESEYEKVR